MTKSEQPTGTEDPTVRATETGDPLVYDLGDVRRVLKIGTPLAREILRKAGWRLGKRYVISRDVLARWLDEKGAQARRRKRSRTAA